MALGALLLLAACERSEPQPQPTASGPQGRMLGEAVAAEPELSTLSGALKAADFTEALDQGMPYTLLAPTNDAFTALGPAWQKLARPGNESKMRNFLREHLIPGYLTPGKVKTTIERNGGKPLTVRSAGEGSVTFRTEGGELVLTTADGMNASIVGDPVRARNGAALPIDTVLAKLPE